MILKKEIDQVCTIHGGSNRVIREVNETRSEFDLHCLIVQQTGPEVSSTSTSPSQPRNIDPKVRLLNDCYAKCQCPTDHSDVDPDLTERTT
jgi:hypothetical protein